MKAAASVDGYIASQPKDARAALKRVRSAVRKALPGAQEVISYQMPAYKLNGRIALYFAAWKEHYSVYPVNDELVAAFARQLARYDRSGKGTIRFPLSEPVPVGLIERLARFRAKQLAAAQAARAARSSAGRRTSSRATSRRTTNARPSERRT